MMLIYCIRNVHIPEQTRLRQSPCRKSWKTRFRCCWFIRACI